MDKREGLTVEWVCETMAKKNISYFIGKTPSMYHASAKMISMLEKAMGRYKNVVFGETTLAKQKTQNHAQVISDRIKRAVVTSIKFCYGALLTFFPFFVLHPFRREKGGMCTVHTQPTQQ